MKIKDNFEKNPLQKPKNIKHVIAVFSGKGGVGKSLITSLLTTQLNKKGFSVGILDADITGASIPKIFGVKEKPTTINKKIIPIKTKSGIKIISANLFLENENQPFIWRGPLISSMVKQFILETDWGDLDYLIIDLPPGTSDSPLTVMQSILISGLIIVSSPQELVGKVVEKSIKMANLMNVPILGLIENMSYINCPACKEKIYLFGESNSKEIAKQNNLDLISEFPLDPRIAKLCDNGEIEKYSNKNLDLIVEKIIKKIE